MAIGARAPARQPQIQEVVSKPMWNTDHRTPNTDRKPEISRLQSVLGHRCSVIRQVFETASQVRRGRGCPPGACVQRLRKMALVFLLVAVGCRTIHLPGGYIVNPPRSGGDALPESELGRRISLPD